MAYINYLRTLISLKRDSKAPDDHNFVPVHILFDVKFDLWMKAQIVIEGCVTGYRYKDAYCGLFNIDDAREDFFILQINDLDVYAADFGKVYLNGFTK